MPKKFFGAVSSAVLILCILSHSQPTTVDLQDPGKDFAFAEFEPYPEFKNKSASNGNQSQYWRIADQFSFPAGHVSGHFVFGSFKNTLMDRDIVYNGQKLNDGILQRYWLSGGINLVDAPKHSSFFIAGVGINSDFADVGSKDWNTEWIYTHSFKINPNFQWGLGLDIQQYSGRFIKGPFYPLVFRKWQLAPYPLLFVNWRLSETTKLVWDADFVELRKFLGPKLAVTAGVRFNLEFFALKDNASYEYQSAGAETGIQYSLGKHCYLSLKYKELLWGRENLGLPNGGPLHEEDIGSGRSLRLNLAYGI